MPRPWPVRMGARVPSGRAVASASCEEPKRPIPSPQTPLTPKSNFLLNSGNRMLAPPPPATRESLNAPAEVGAVAVGAAEQVMGAPVKVVVEPSALVTTPAAVALTTAHG